MKVSKNINDYEFKVNDGAQELGNMIISDAGVVWLKKATSGKNEFTKSWKELIEFFEL